ncbi:PREDICTED: protein strawberry notch [Tarenaya hassleriana]|uniref:protein strawberry notch n=1 Tax=Tarenaya hassleriana TaxID=28532 RepID=UPI00053C33C3|nr:PREDICTED: protein strawberry notch [Tarenaya hassleriana]
MTQPPAPPLPAPPPQSSSGSGGGGGGGGGGRAEVQVRCAGCRVILRVKTGVVEFSCPTCQLPQMLPPELIARARPHFQQPQPIQTLPPLQQQLKPLNLPRPPVPAHGIDPTKMQLPCANCQAILNVPHGLTRFSCPQCNVELAVDVSKLNQSLSAPPPAQAGPSPAPPPPPEEVNEVAIEVEREEDEGGTVGETFMDYRPPKLSIGPPHPDPIVETSSLSAVQPPEPTYNLKIKDELERSKALSCLQIETLVYACQRHLQHLADGTRAGFFVGDGAGVGKGRTIAGLIWENWQRGRRKALWISVGSDLKYDARRDLDDVGATCAEVHALNKLPYSKLDSKSVGIKEGVVFLTYNSLIASSEKGRSRMQQLVQWCGPGFDGLVIFDECHKAKNLVPEAGSQPTRIGQAVVDIQDKLPEARVLYCSATGASEPRNMGYMVRLGLWGAGTSFSEFNEFLVALDKGGVGALELVAMDMKARGMYVCRTLSYKGAEFEIVEAPLEAEMEAMYKKAAEFWAELRVELLSASAFLPNEKPNSSQLWRLYWSSHQRFFRHLCMSAKVPATVRLAKQALSQNKCVVIGLQSTGEARTEEAVTKYGLELDDFVSGPRELLLKFVEENYPLPEKPEPLSEDEGVKELPRKRRSASPGVSFRGRVRKMAKWKPDSDDESDFESEGDSVHDSNDSDDEFQICQICNGEEERKKLLHCSECEKLIHPSCVVPPVTEIPPEPWTCLSCKEKTEEYIQARRLYIAELQKRYEAAVERKLKILEIVRSLNLPNNPLDDIIDQLGGPENVAEITGRRGMLVRASNGKGVTYQARNTKDITMEMVNMHEKQLFMDGKKLVAIISEAGSAGVSLQADRRAANQKRRVHLTLELPWSADRAIQQFGRTHRSNQTSAPEYSLIFTNLGGERRFASIVAKRLETLGALTQGDRRAGPSLSAYNYDSHFGKKALMVMYRGIMEQENLPVVPPGCSSDEPETSKDFLKKARAALISVGIVRDSVMANGKDFGKISGRIVDSDMHDVGRFLNRLLGLPPDIQNRLFELFASILDFLVHNARIEGNLDSGIVDMKANSIELQGSPKTVHVDQMSGASTMLFTFTLDRGVTWETASSMLTEKKRDGLGSASDGFYESKREWLGRRHFILAFESAGSGLFKIVRPAVGESIREMPLSELKSKYRKLSSLEKACNGWEDEYEVSSKQCMHGSKCKLGDFCTVGRRIQEVNVLGGLILPVWGTIEKALSKQARQSHKRLRVVRIQTTTDNRRIVGLFVPNAAVETVLEDLAWVQDLDD